MTRDDISAVLVLLLILLMAMVPTPASAQEQAEEVLPLRIELVEFDDHPNIAVTVSVPRPLVGKDIPADKFVVVDSGAPVAPSVEKLSNDDLEVVLVLDTSGSMAGPPLAEAKAAAVAFIAQLPQGVRLSAVSFGSEPRTVAGFTTDLEQVDAAIARLQAAGETALYDGIVTAASLFDAGTEARRAVVLLSDGGDTVSSETLEVAIIDLLAAGADFYAVALETSEADSATLNRMAVASAGQVVAADDPAALSGIFNEIAAGLVNRYRLDYTTESFGSTEVVVGVVADGILAQGAERVTFPASPAVPAAPSPPPAAPQALEPVTPPPLPVAQSAPGLLGNPAALWAGAGAIFLASSIILGLALTAKRRIRLGGALATRNTEDESSALANRAILFAEEKLGDTKGQSGLSSLLERAGSALRPGEFLLMATSAAMVAFALGYFAGGLLPAALLGGLVVAGARLPLEVRATKRQTAFANQLGDNLQLIAGSVRAGYGLVQAIDTVAHEALPPTSDEFRRIVAEVNLGRDTGEALRASAERTRSEDFTWVVEAMDVHRQVGGDLSELLESVAATIRERTQLRRKVQALSAEGRLSAIILLALPFAIGGFITVVNPTYMRELYITGMGQSLIALGLVLMTVGVFWMRKVIDLDY